MGDRRKGAGWGAILIRLFLLEGTMDGQEFDATNTQDGSDGAQGTEGSAVATDGAAQATGSASAGEDTFLTDKQIMEKVRANPELLHVWKKMQGSFTRRMQQASKVRDAASM